MTEMEQNMFLSGIIFGMAALHMIDWLTDILGAYLARRSKSRGSKP